MQNRQEIKMKIALYEVRKNGKSRIIEIKNLRIHKDKYIADVILESGKGDDTEIYSNCKYKKEDIDNI